MADDNVVAVHDAEIKRLQKDMDKLVEDMEAIKESLHSISITLAEAKGGWHMFIVLGTLGAAVGAACGWVVEQFLPK